MPDHPRRVRQGYPSSQRRTADARLKDQFPSSIQSPETWRLPHQCHQFLRLNNLRQFFLYIIKILVLKFFLSINLRVFESNFYSK